MDAVKIRNAIEEISNSMVRTDAERDLVKEIINKINEEEGMDKRVLRKMARAYHKQNFHDEAALHEEFEVAFTNIMLKDQ